MSSIPKYIQLTKHIRNWMLYFRRMHEKQMTAQYVTRGVPLNFDVPPRFYEVFREIFMENFYRIDDLVKDLPAKPVVVDIGGNVGYFSFLLASKKPGAHIYAYEPMEDNLQLFRSNLALNPGLGERVQVTGSAVTGNHNGHIDLYFDDKTDNSVIASVVKDFSAQNSKVKQVEAISLEKIFSDHSLNYIDLLKVDCEGSEYPIFYDSPPQLFDRVKMIAIETHDLDNERRNTGAIAQFLEEKGFSTTRFIAENNCYYLKAIRRTIPAV